MDRSIDLAAAPLLLRCSPSTLWCAAIGAASGFATVVAFAPTAVWPLVFVCVAPLGIVCARSGLFGSVLAGWIAGLVVYGVGYRALLTATARLQGWTLQGSAEVFAVFAAIHGIQWAAASAAFHYVTPKGLVGDTIWPRIRAAVSMASIWVLLEYAVPQLIPWTIGASLGPSAVFRQSADVAGAYGLAFVVIMINALVAFALQDWAARRFVLAGVGVLATSAVLGAMAAYGHWALWTASEGGRTLTVMAVQGGINDSPDASSNNEKSLVQYSELSEHAATSTVDLVVWPETAIRVYLRQNRAYRDSVSQLTDRIGAPIILGAVDHPSGSGDVELNSAYLVPEQRGDDGTSELQIYYKSTLVPFAEYVPFREQWLTSLFHTTGNFAPGAGTTVFSVSPGRSRSDKSPMMASVAASICFEAVFPGSFNAAVWRGAQMLVNLTNDAWFDGTVEPSQHLEMARLRAVETRRWLVRSSRSGISAFFDPKGEIVSSLAFGTEGTLTEPVQLSNRITPYVRFGNWIIGVSMLVLAIESILFVVDGAGPPGVGRWLNWRGELG